MKRYLKRASTVAPHARQNPELRSTVEGVLADVRLRGDVAVLEYSVKFDNWSPEPFRMTPEQIQEAVDRVPNQTIEDIREAQANVRRFAELQRASLTDFESEVQPGIVLGQTNIPIAAVGAYIPGGRYPLLASAHMTIIPAKVAGVERVIACTPTLQGKIPDATVAAILMAGADEIYLLGGIQAIAAMAIGTETIDLVDMLTGPGNPFVTEAKRQLFGEVGIDLFAGPTEILIVADATADPLLTAVDLLSQAEHGPDSPAILVTTSERVGLETLAHIEKLLPGLSTNEIAGAAWRDHGQVVQVDSLDEAYELANEIASEHVQIFTAQPRDALAKMVNYGALFLGEKTCVSFGDKVIGTNHVLPTRGAARYTGGLWVGKFLKTVTYQEVTTLEASGKLGELCGRAARAENFEGHARSGDIRAAMAAGVSPSWLP